MSTIYTVGHGLLPVDRLLDNLRRHSVGAVIDVRSQPYSRRAPQFNKDALRDALEQGGITYIWMGQALGGRPPDRLRTTGGAPDYESMSREPATAEALDRVVEAGSRRTLALLCSESQPDGCHRTRMLAPELERRGATVANILPDGTLAERPTLFV